MSLTSVQQLVNKLTKLGDKLHLNREQAQASLENQVLPEICQEGEESDLVTHSRQIIIDILKIMYNSQRWEDRFGAMNGSILLIQKFYDANRERGVDPALKDFVWNFVRGSQLPLLMVDKEFRVRNQLGPLLRMMIIQDQEKGAQHFDALKEMLLKNIEDTFTREPDGGMDASANPKVINKDETGKTMHDTEGWKSLETSMRILQNIIEAIGPKLYDFELDRILVCIKKGVDHINRFVREISYFVIHAIFETSAKILSQSDPIESQVERFREFTGDLVPIIAQGLGDNWSQVRYAASQATRSFYFIIKGDETMREKYDPILVPRMCMNRYYVAEGVKIYSNDTWRMVHEDKGKEAICKYAEQVCTFYISQSTADNHAVREAACHCISELCTKVAAQVDKEPFKPFIAPMLSALLDCFKDASWPVRDCACIACGHFVATFPEESKTVFPELLHLWIEHLSDNIQSVRHHSAQSLATIMDTLYKDELSTEIVSHVSENLLKAKEQSQESQKFKGLQNETQFGVAKPVESEEHSNNQLYSCGSLAPKLKRGGGCMDHGFSRAKEMWELSDGAIFMLREIAHVESMQDLVVKNLENISTLAYIDHFKHAHTLKETIFKSMTVILKGIGKKKFRGYVELYLDPTFRAANNLENLNMAVAAQDFILDMEKTYGPGIFKAILEGHDDRYIQDLERFKQEGAKSGPKDFVYPPQPAGALNPFGIGGPDMNVMTKAPWAK